MRLWRARAKRTEAGFALTCPLPWAGLLLQEMTMAGLHELRFTEEKPLLRGQDAELVSLVTTLALAPACGAPARGGLGGAVCGTGHICGTLCMCWVWGHIFGPQCVCASGDEPTWLSTGSGLVG